MVFMKLTKLEKIAAAGALASSGVACTGSLFDSEKTILAGGISAAICVGYLLTSQIIGYRRDLKELEAKAKEIYKNLNKE